MSTRSLLGFTLLLFNGSCLLPETTAGAIAPPPSRSTPSPADLRKNPATHPMQRIQATYGVAPAAPPFTGTAQGDSAERSLDCLTAAVYYEARSEPASGQRAVAQVVLNRVRHSGFPNSVCGVVYQGANRGAGCQFTFACDGSLAYRREAQAWERAREVAQAALDGDVYAPVGLATYYHTTAVQPWWSRSLDRIATIGTQIFYRWRGRLGNALAFHQQYSGVEPGDYGADGAPAAALSPTRLTRYAVDGATVTVHRGGGGATSEFSPADATTTVRIHRGSPAAQDSAQEASNSMVRIHRGTSSEEVGPI